MLGGMLGREGRGCREGGYSRREGDRETGRYVGWEVRLREREREVGRRRRRDAVVIIVAPPSG